jgi:multidrug/hemolysin transport system permease protein
MPLASFSEGLRDVLMFLPGTYGTALIRNHTLNGVIKEMSKSGLPEQAIKAFRDAIDVNIYFFDNEISLNLMACVITLSAVLLIASYVLINVLNKNKKK